MNLEAIDEKQKDTILIIDSNDDIHSFYLWDGSYFKDIYKYKNFKTDLYIRKNEETIFQKYIDECSPKIKNLLSF